MTKDLTIVIPIFDGMTQLDFTGPHQFFSRVAKCTTIVASKQAKPIEADGLVFSNLSDLNQLESCDVLCVPGGAAPYKAFADDEFIGSVRRLAATATYITSVCTGSLILGAAGLLLGRRAACHWAYRDMLPALGAIPDAARVVRDGNVITGGGVTAGIDFALSVIAELRGEAAAKSIQLAMEYAPSPPFQSGSPDLTQPAILEAVQARLAPVLALNREYVELAAKRLSGVVGIATRTPLGLVVPALTSGKGA